MSRMDPETRLRNYQSSTQGIFTYGALCKGRYTWRINPQGWNSLFDYKDSAVRENPMVALIGDSYIEGFWSDLNDHIDVLMHEKSNQQIDFYSFGTWGAMLSQYLIISKDIILKYQPDVIVIFLNEEDAVGSLYTDASRFLFCHTIEALPNGLLQTVPPLLLSNSRLIPILLKSATLRYLKTNRNLASLARGAVVDPNANLVETEVSCNEEQAFDSVAIQVTEFLLDEFDLLPVPVIFVADGPRAPVYRDEADPGRYPDCVLIQNLCTTRDNLVFIDLLPYFQRDWSQSHTFFNSEINPHWDGYGNAVVTEAIYRDVVNAI